MKKRTRERLVLPILLPLGILAGMLLLMVAFSRILLNTTAEAATLVALVVTITILAAAGVSASRSKVRPASLGSLLGVVAGVAMLAGGIALAVAQPAEEGEKVEVFRAELSAQPGAATDGFDQSELAWPSDTPIQLSFDNADPGVQHNVEVYEGEDASGTQAFSGEVITGPAKATYNISPLKEGAYYFRCVVHPTTMTGAIEAAPGVGEGGGGGPVVEIAASNLEFDTDTLEFETETPTTLRFDNQDAGVPHNVSIYEDDTLETVLFQQEPTPGPKVTDYAIPALPEGEYFFMCDVHPTMKGTVIVGGGPGGGGEGGGGVGGEKPPPEEPTTQPTESPLPEGGGAAAATITVVAKDIAFDVTEISLKTDSETTLVLDNQDDGVPHNLAIYSANPADDVNAETLFTNDIFDGVATKKYTIPGLPAGEYYFQCDVHLAAMAGTVTVA